VILSGRASAPGRVLLVDDDADAALFAAHVLSALGQFVVTHTADPAAALRLVARGDCDLLLTETELPRLSGHGLVQAARQLAPALPVVVLTVHLLDPADAAALRDLTDAYLEKPVSPGHLIAAVATALARPDEFSDRGE
jgi:CheY-like chemotaxis protein